MEKPSRLLNRHFVLLWQGQTVSLLGNQAFGIACAFWIKHETGSATLMGLMYMLSGLAAVSLGPISGAIADRYSRRNIIIGCDVAAGAATLSLAGLMLLRPEATSLIVIAMAAVCLALGVTASLFTPAITAAIPDLAPGDRIAGANSLIQMSLQGSTFVGQAIGGTLFRILGAPVLFLFDGITYLFSAASVSFISIPQKIEPRDGSWRVQFTAFKRDIAAGLAYIWQRSGLKALVLASALTTAVMVPVVLLLPFYIEDYLRLTPDWYGFLLASYGVGSLTGYAFAGAVRMSQSRRGAVMMVFLLAQSAGPAALAVIRTPLAALAATFAGGLLSGFIAVGITSILQQSTPSEIRGRVFGLLATISASIAPLSNGATGLLTDLIGQNIPAVYAGCGFAAATIAGALTLNKNYRDFLRSGAGPAPANDVKAEAAVG